MTEVARTQGSNGELLEVVHHEADRFYELLVDGKSGGLVVYNMTGSRMVFTHTFISDGFQGRGLVNVMLHATLDDIRAQQRVITNFCPVLDTFIAKNPEYIPLIDVAHPGSWAHRDAATES